MEALNSHSLFICSFDFATVLFLHPYTARSFLVSFLIYSFTTLMENQSMIANVRAQFNSTLPIFIETMLREGPGPSTGITPLGITHIKPKSNSSVVSARTQCCPFWSHVLEPRDRESKGFKCFDTSPLSASMSPYNFPPNPGFAQQRLSQYMRHSHCR